MTVPMHWKVLLFRAGTLGALCAWYPAGEGLKVGCIEGSLK